MTWDEREPVTVSPTLDPAWATFLDDVYNVALDGLGYDLRLTIAEATDDDARPVDVRLVVAHFEPGEDGRTPFVTVPLTDQAAHDGDRLLVARVAELIVETYERALAA